LCAEGFFGIGEFWVRVVVDGEVDGWGLADLDDDWVGEGVVGAVVYSKLDDIRTRDGVSFGRVGFGRGCAISEVPVVG